MFPKVISAARRIASGSAVGTKERENWNRSSARILTSRPYRQVHPRTSIKTEV